MRRITFVSLAAAFALSACGSSDADQDGDGTITSEEAAAETAEGSFPDPGLYKVSVEIEELTYPGMTAGMADQMKRSMSANMAVEECITESDRQDAVKQMAKGASDDENCTYSKYDLSGGRIDAVMSCKSPDGGTLNYTMAGTMNSTGVDMRMEGGQQSADPSQAMTMKMHLKSQRIGNCPA